MKNIFAPLIRRVPAQTPSVLDDAPNTFRLLCTPHATELRKEFPTEEYTLLFVLEGGVRAVFTKDAHRTAHAGEFLAFHNPALKSLHTSAGAVLIRHTPPAAVARQFDACVEAFHTPSSEPLPILPSLGVWLEALRGELAVEELVCSEQKERQLAGMLSDIVSASRLGEVYIAYYSCRNRFENKK